MLDVPCRALLLGLGCNPKLSDVSLDLSCCEVTPVRLHRVPLLVKTALKTLSSFCSQLRSGGSQILEGCVAEIPNITSLDISDNGGNV